MTRNPDSKTNARKIVQDIRATLPHQKPTTARQVLENAIAVLQRPNGWGKGSELKVQTGEACAIGALMIADGGVIQYASGKSASFRLPRRDSEPLQEAMDAVRGVLGGHSIIGFNDGQAKSAKNVIAKFRAALKTVKSRR